MKGQLDNTCQRTYSRGLPATSPKVFSFTFESKVKLGSPLPQGHPLILANTPDGRERTHGLWSICGLWSTQLCEHWADPPCPSARWALGRSCLAQPHLSRKKSWCHLFPSTCIRTQGVFLFSNAEFRAPSAHIKNSCVALIGYWTFLLDYPHLKNEGNNCIC